MPVRRTLALKREVLQVLSDDDLTGIAGGAQDTLRPTAASCLDYISCWAWQCLPRTLVCVE